MIYLLLVLIAVGVLLISEPGKILLKFFVVWGIRIFLFLLIVGAILVGYFLATNNVKTKQTNLNTAQPISDFSQVPPRPAPTFPMDDSGSQYSWYDQHNVSMADRCYPGGTCSAQDWANAVYGNKSDSQGFALKQQADDVWKAYIAKFPTEKCVTESGVKICDLSNSIQETFGDGTREVNFQANAIDCINVATGNQTQSQGDTAEVANGNTYCASDLGGIYIDPTIQVKKYFGKITNNNNSSYQVPASYDTCIWTYADGSGDVPYIEVSNNVGPTSGYGVRAFCRNGNNQIDIYSYQE